MVRLPTATPLMLTEHVETPVAPGTSEHEAAGLNVSAEEEEKVTVPVGLDFVPVVPTSVTVAEAVPACPAASGLGATTTAVEVERVLIWSVRLAVLDCRTPGTPA